MAFSFLARSLMPGYSSFNQVYTFAWDFLLVLLYWLLRCEAPALKAVGHSPHRDVNSPKLLNKLGNGTSSPERKTEFVLIRHMIPNRFNDFLLLSFNQATGCIFWSSLRDGQNFFTTDTIVFIPLSNRIWMNVQ